MAAPPKIATCPNTTDLITTAQLQGAYARACDPKLVETATRPLFEELLNEYLRSPSLSVFGEQQLDDDGQRVDIAVGFHDRNSLPNLVFVLLAETKRHKQTNRFEVEPQLEEYADRYLDQAFGGCAIHHTVFGAAAMTYSGRPRVVEETAYWDVKTDGVQILAVLREVWQLRQRLAQITGA